MRKIITFNIIFCLILIFSAYQSYGQDTQINEDKVEGEQVGTANVVDMMIMGPLLESMGSSGYGAELIVMPIWAGVILGGFLIGDLVADTCVSRWHPGDFYYEKNYKIMKTKKYRNMELL